MIQANTIDVTARTSAGLRKPRFKNASAVASVLITNVSYVRKPRASAMRELGAVSVRVIIPSWCGIAYRMVGDLWNNMENWLALYRKEGSGTADHRKVLACDTRQGST